MHWHYNPKKDRSEEFGWSKLCDEKAPTEQEQVFWGNVSIIFVIVLASIAVFL